MINEPLRFEEISVFRRAAPRISFVAALALSLAAVAPMALAQTNIDQGKTPAEIFANDCAVCHKTPRGLAAGKNSLMLSGFLREHYTASRDQAAALAAYVLGAGGSGPAPPATAQKPGSDRTRAAVEEPKSGEPRTAEPKIAEPKGDAKGEPKTAARPTHPSAKPEEEGRPVTASRGRKQEPEPVAPVQEPAAIIAAPPASEMPRSAEAPSQDANPATSAPAASTSVPATSAAAPAESEPSDTEAVPRDDIPD